MADLLPKKKVPTIDSKKFTPQDQNRVRNRKIFVLSILAAILMAIGWINQRKDKSSDLTQNRSKTFIEHWQAGEQEENSQVQQNSSIKENSQVQQNSQINQRLSLGDKILIGTDNNPDKQLAVKKFAEGNFKEAQIKFTRSLEHHPNDPEALIYLNNSLAETGSSDIITIGVSIPVGGSLDVSKEILRGVAQAQNEINKQGGIERDGIKNLLRVQIANDDNEPETAKQIAANFVANPKIIGVVGHNSSTSSIAAAPIYQKGGLVMISPTSVARDLSQAGNYIFRTTPSTRVLAETLARYTVENSRRQKIAVCVDSSSAASTSFKDEFSLSLFELGGAITPVNCDFASKNFNPDQIPSKAIANGSEALLLIPSVNKINQALEVARANQNRLVMLGNHSMYTYETLKIGQSDIKGIVLPTAWHPGATAGSPYNQNARKLWGMEGNWRTATAYDATKALIIGLTAANTRQGLQQALTNPGFAAPGALGKINFQLSGDRQIAATLVKVQSGKSSGTGYDFMPMDSMQLTRKSSKKLPAKKE